MTDTKSGGRPVHLVGAIALDTVAETFKTVGRLVGDRLARVPDGEPGGRRMWIAWQFPLLRANPYLQAVVPRQGASAINFPFMRLADGVDPADLRFCELGYAREARASYADFLSAKSAGAFPAHSRFQVSLPTPYAVVSAFCVADANQAQIERAYEGAMAREIDMLCESIPHESLAIQWDVCPEMILWDGRMKRAQGVFDDPHEAILSRLERISQNIPSDVQLGFHLCYGDVDGRHFIEPEDCGKLVEFANALGKRIPHDIAYIHMPVPISRTDSDYFRPLGKLSVSRSTELYLGCVHVSDGVEGTRKRIAAAGQFVSDFGIATECGMGRCKTPEVVKNLLEIHAAAAA